MIEQDKKSCGVSSEVNFLVLSEVLAGTQQEDAELKHTLNQNGDSEINNLK